VFGEMYKHYELEPVGMCGLNVCCERDIRR
jgi:hypothetical protein